MTQYRYRPAGNRTPVMHPIIGHLVWDQVVNNPACAGNPDFEAIEASDTDPSGASGIPGQVIDPGAPQNPDPSGNPVDPPAPVDGDTTVDDPSDTDPAAKRLGAGKTGRSTTP